MSRRGGKSLQPKLRFESRLAGQRFYARVWQISNPVARITRTIPHTRLTISELEILVSFASNVRTLSGPRKNISTPSEN
jgi:hypothetical protein